MLTIDGSMGEGGGQLLRSSLALSLLSCQPFRISGIRAGRARPGLMRQHLAAVNAAAEVGAASVSGAEIGSTELQFEPKTLRAGDFAFATGGAGSTTLVFQTVLFPLLLGARGPSTLTFEGGTHNPMAPPFEFLERSFLPMLARMGAQVELGFERYGFYPAGGGRWSARIQPCPRLTALELLERGALRSRSAIAHVAHVPPSVALREIDAFVRALDWERSACRPNVIQTSPGPGNAFMAIVESERVTEVVTAFGDRGVSAEAVAQAAARDIRRYLAVDVPVGEHLADQLLLPLALGEGGVFRTLKPSQHCLTQLELLRLFIGTVATVVEEASDVWRIEVRAMKASSPA